MRVLRKLKWTALTIGLLLSVGCSQVNSSPSGCQALTLKTYSAAAQKLLAAEVTAASETAVWPQAMIDYAGLRNAVKACGGK
jgi:hypothetical protein